MKIIRPSVINDAALISSSEPEDDYAAWSAVTTYALADRAVKAHRIWESLQAANTNHDPASSPTWWADMGPTNRWAMFDGVVGTLTEATETLTVVIAPGRLDALALFNVDAAACTITMRVGVEVVFDYSESLIDDAKVTDWYLYFFEPILPKDYVLVENIPVFGEAETTITLTKNAGTVLLGLCVAGLRSDVGKTLKSPSLGINDYSKKDTNAFGQTTLVQRSFSKRMTAKLMVDNGSVDRVHAALSAVRAIPVVWIGDGAYSSMLIYGFFRDFDIDVAYSSFSYCTLNIEGMI